MASEEAPTNRYDRVIVLYVNRENGQPASACARRTPDDSHYQRRLRVEIGQPLTPGEAQMIAEHRLLTQAVYDE